MINKLSLKEKKAISHWMESTGRTESDIDFAKVRKVVIREKGKFRFYKHSNLDETEQFNEYISTILEAQFPKSVI